VSRALVLTIVWTAIAGAQAPSLEHQLFAVDPEFAALRPRVIAVLPMVNMTFDPSGSDVLYDEVYRRLQSKGYRHVGVERVRAVMTEMGVQIPEMLSGISTARLCRALECDGVLRGQVVQSGTEHKVVLDSVVVSVSLQLVHCDSGRTIWFGEQWRAAHRQFQFDPLNALINLIAHERASKAQRIAWLVEQMFRTLPDGALQVVEGDLLSRAIEVPVSPDLRPDRRGDLTVDVSFEPGTAALSDAARAALDRLADVLATHRQGDVVLTGVVDGRDPDAASLAHARATACRDRLAARLDAARFRLRVGTGPGGAGAGHGDASGGVRIRLVPAVH
jgi:hypothetical protein